MARLDESQPTWDPDEFEEDLDPEGPSEADLEAFDADDDSDTIVCPYCRRAVYAEAEWCPYCERWIERAHAETWVQRHPVYAVIVILVLISFVLVFVL